MTTPYEFAQANAERFLSEYKDLIRIPSISTDPAFAGDVRKAADWLATMLRGIGLDAELINMPEGRHPLVFAQWNGAGDAAPTVLVYCHYDVQPAVVADGWHTDPFEPTEKEGKLYARGATDSKIHVMAWSKAVESLLQTNPPAVNIKLLFEGEEESGGETVDAFVDQHPDKVAADVVVISDGTIRAPDQPSITYGLRGIITFEVHLDGPQRDLHSGHWGGTVHNPAQVIAEIVAQLHDESGLVTVPGFYDNVNMLEDDEREILAASDAIIAQEWDDVANASAHWGEPDYSLHERIGARPTLEINGISGGYTGDGFKTVLPGHAFAKISCRLVPNQDPERILQIVTDHIQELAPPTVTVDIRNASFGAPAIVLDRESSAVKSASAAYAYAWGKETMFGRAGGSVPITFKMAKVTDNITLMGFTYKGGSAHGPNENVIIDMFHKGIAAAIHFLSHVDQN